VRIISNEPGRFDLRLELSQVDLNVELKASAFQVAIPPGTQPIAIDELRAGGPLSR
jgi:outer membrane lipoprotein-sorting protein